MRFAGKTVVLCVTGGIAAYKAADLTSKLHQNGAEVRVLMTESATQFISPVTFETASRATARSLTPSTAISRGRSSTFRSRRRRMCS